MNTLRPLGLSLFATLSLVAGSTVLADDLELFQGKWEMRGTSGDKPVRVLKTIEGKKETVELYVDGKLQQRHHVDIELKSFGPAKVFQWKNGRITAGPRAGQKLGDGRFLYKIDGKKLIGIHGMLDGDKQDVLRETYIRISDPPRNAT